MQRIPLAHWFRKTTVWNRSCVNNKALKVWKMPHIFFTEICTNPFLVKLWKGQCLCNQWCLLVCRGNNKSKNKDLMSLVGCVLVYRYTKEQNINELHHNSMYGYENNRNSPVYRYTRKAPFRGCLLLSDFQDDGQALTQWRVPYWRMSLYRKRPEHQSKLTIFICNYIFVSFCQGLIGSPQCAFLGLWSLEELCYKLHVTLLTSLTVNFANILSNL